MKLLSKTEKLEHVVEDSTFYYRRINVSEMELFRAKNTARGELKAIKFGLDVCEAAVIDWKGIVDDDGKPVKFKKELIEFLPVEVVSTLGNLICGGSGEIEKNL